MWYVKKYTYFFYKQPVFKVQARGWQIAKQLSGLNPFTRSNNKENRLKKVEFFLCNKRKLTVKQTIYHNSAVSKTLLGKS